MPPKPRIALGADPDGLQSPFAGLTIPGLPEGPPDPPRPVPSPAGQPGKLVFRKEKAHRSGKSVVVVSGFPPSFPQESIEKMARDIRRHCGCGGTVRPHEIEFQGDDPDRFRKVFHDLFSSGPD
jgi:translation initiation factor 1